MLSSRKRKFNQKKKRFHVLDGTCDGGILLSSHESGSYVTSISFKGEFEKTSTNLNRGKNYDGKWRNSGYLTFDQIAFDI